MVNQGPDRRRQATPGRKDDVKDTLLAAPIREHMDELALPSAFPQTWRHATSKRSSAPEGPSYP